MVFLFLFQLLRLRAFAGEFGQFLGAIALPGAFMLFLAALPFIDRSPRTRIFFGDRSPYRLACGNDRHSCLYCIRHH